MLELSPDSRQRISLAELGGVSLEGGPSTARVRRASDGVVAEWSPASGEPPLAACPDLLDVSWELHGVTVSAEVDLVASSYCSLADIKGYRASEYRLGDALDSEVMAARSRAIEVIEREAKRHLQPVMRTGVVDRPNCSPTAMPIMGDVPAHDVIAVARAVSQSGSPVQVRRASAVALDVRDVRPGEFAEVSLVMGMRPTPTEVKAAVTALAAYYLVPKAGPDNATSETTDAGGVISYVLGGVNGAATSIPEVNAVIARYGIRDYRVG